MMSNNLYLCDPVKNTFCPKTNCHNPCYHTLDPEFAWDPILRVRLDEGVIDEGYTGTILVKLYNHGTEAKQFSRGDKITQLVVLPVLYLRGSRRRRSRAGPEEIMGMGVRDDESFDRRKPLHTLEYRADEEPRNRSQRNRLGTVLELPHRAGQVPAGLFSV